MLQHLEYTKKVKNIHNLLLDPNFLRNFAAP
jgi:hypothetical protein